MLILMLNLRQGSELFYRIGTLGGDGKDASKLMFQIFMLNHRQGLEVEFHPEIKPGRESRSIKGDLIIMFSHHLALLAVLLAQPLQEQLLVDQLRRIPI